MKETFKKIWQFSQKRHDSVIRGLAASFLRSVFGVTQLLSIIYAIDVLTGNLDVRSGVIRIAILTLICVLGNFAASYFEQINTMKTGFFSLHIVTSIDLRRIDQIFWDV